MIALVDNLINYSKDVNIGRNLVVTEGVSARLRIKEPLNILNMRRAREAHQRVIRNNINRYGKIKR